jgi:hypothetical protein
MKTIAIAATAAIALGATSAGAATLITSAKIQDGTIQNRDIHKDTIGLNRLSKGTQALIRKAGTPGKNGTNGAPGAPGANGANGVNGVNGANGTNATIDAGNWGIVNRNVIGSPDITFRDGPATPPLGKGSLNIVVGDSTEKAAFGNEVDFAGTPLNAIDTLGFSVYTTGENRAISPANLPSMGIEIDPTGPGNAAAPNFSTLVSLPVDAPANVWSRQDVSGGQFFLTGAAGTASNCTQANTCTLAQVKAAFPAATLFSVQITKGRDNAFQGAVDAITVNAKTYDLEVTGVK